MLIFCKCKYINWYCIDMRKNKRAINNQTELYCPSQLLLFKLTNCSKRLRPVEKLPNSSLIPACCQKGLFCHHLNKWILMSVEMTTNVSWLKPLMLSFGLFNGNVMVDINFVWMLIFLFYPMWEKIFTLPFSSGSKCLNNHYIEFSYIIIIII